MAFDVDARAVRRYAVGDGVVIVLFVVLGELSHGANPLTILGPMALTMSTFLFGWFTVATVSGAYGSGTLTGQRRAVGLPVVGWAFADAIAQVLRSTESFPGNADLSFYLVALIFGGALLGFWRYIAFRISQRSI
ncbi:putative membrane protein [Halanaeroarchaeum sp. HSR-CO]|uniref:DUF3054 domain-containing protein n=1 Tax=Halanaeroarchaeum sp. HSR-CO TaxID=2866382 RepID=UPI00217F0960|nr:DUF3054 domain-containing protein [Halanaeroarchaeum sp. HSR-CO]UWG47760.1 putative membrane protein [Halanaeroarchaeum sp. HSR-CO]